MDGVGFSAGARDFTVLHSVQAGSETHPASNPVSIRVFYSGIKRTFLKLVAIHVHPVPRPIMMELYLHSPILLHGAVLN
jgi:hypothetical protein